MKIKFEDHTFQARVRRRLTQINGVLEEFTRQGYRLTVRQLFYQFVARGWLDNTYNRYQNIISWTRNGRMAGEIDWDHIEDRLREVLLATTWTDHTDRLFSAAKNYRLDRQLTQDNHIEIWAEKDAISQVLEPVAWEYGIPLLIGRGEFSVSCIFEAVEERMQDESRPIRILYFGDHDPSGILSIEKNVRETLPTMLAQHDIHDVEIIRVAVPENPGILEKLPPNTVKEKDKRTPRYRELYGEKCWELEALPPNVIRRMLDQELKRWMDFEAYQEILADEKKDKTRLDEIANAEYQRMLGEMKDELKKLDEDD